MNNKYTQTNLPSLTRFNSFELYFTHNFRVDFIWSWFFLWRHASWFKIHSWNCRIV